MKIDITKFQDIKPTRGGKATAIFTLGRQGYFMGNHNYLEENKEFKNALSVNMKALKEEDKIVVLITFLEDKTGLFVTNEFKDDKKIIKRKSFSARSIFKQLGLSYKDFAQKKTLKLIPEKQKINGIDYFVVEIPIE